MLVSLAFNEINSAANSSRKSAWVAVVVRVKLAAILSHFVFIDGEQKFIQSHKFARKDDIKQATCALFKTFTSLEFYSYQLNGADYVCKYKTWCVEDFGHVCNAVCINRLLTLV